MKKRILILIPRMNGGGTERVVSVIANYLCGEYDIQITTLVSRESFYPLNASISFTSACFEINRSSKFTRLASMCRNFIRSILFVRETIREYKPQVILSFIEEMDITAFLATRGLTGFKIIYSERNDPTRRSRMFQNILERIYKTADGFVCQTETVSRYYSMVDAGKKSVISNPVDFSLFPQKTEESRPLKIVTVGRLVKQKNILLLVDAFAKIADKYPSVKVFAYGEGPERNRIEERIARHHLENRFFLPGKTADVLNTIKDAAVFAFPTNFEGFPNALIEAVALGIPVVTTDFATGVARDLVPKENGIVVPCNDVEAFSSALDELLGNDEKRNGIRNSSRNTLQSLSVQNIATTWKKMIEGYLEVA